MQTSLPLSPISQKVVLLGQLGVQVLQVPEIFKSVFYYTSSHLGQLTTKQVSD